MEEIFRDFDWGLDRFVEYNTDRLSQEKKHYQLKNHFRF